MQCILYSTIAAEVTRVHVDKAAAARYENISNGLLLKKSIQSAFLYRYVCVYVKDATSCKFMLHAILR